MLNVEVPIESGFDYGGRTLLHYKNDGAAIRLTGKAPGTSILILGGEPIGAPVVSNGPFVMNDQTQIIEAMGDYPMVKMGFYVD